MANMSATLLVAVGDSLVCLKLIGRANLTTSADFKPLVNSLQAKGHGRFVLDLSECVGMDSTFLGMLSAFAQRLGEAVNGAARIDLLNANPRVIESLDNLDALKRFNLVSGAVAFSGRYEPVPPGTFTKNELASHSLEAHRFLMQAHPENARKFQDVVRMLEEEVAKGVATPS